MARIINILLIFFILGFIAVGLFMFGWVKSLAIPDFETFEERKIIQSTKIYDRTGKNLLYDVHENIKRSVIPYEDIPRHIKNATVAIEDSDFYQHKGISFLGIARAFFINLGAGKIKQGGSTITQQLIKNTFLTPEKTFTRKLKEVLLSLKLEGIFSKEKILTLYLNEVPYGGSNYGIEAATQSFFAKPAKELTLAESAYLAALPKAPTYYSPYGSHREELEQRKNFVLSRMLDLGFIEKGEFEKAKNEKVAFVNPSEKVLKAPHFVMFIKSYLEQKYGKDMVEQGGLEVITTLDLRLQKEAEKLVALYSKENEKKFNAQNAGLIGIDPKTGQIIVMVGSRDYFDKEYEGKFNTTLAKRQPGSAFKPFVYATAFKKGYTPKTVVFDLKTEFNSSCNPDGTPKPNTQEDECYRPQNYDGIFRGPVNLRDALAQSINIPAIKVLYLSGIKDSLETAKDFGITTLEDPLRYGLTLVLGGGEVTLLEITGAYSVFANNGMKNPLTSILKITDSKGNVVEEFIPRSKQVLDEKIAVMINDILSDNDARAPAFGQHSWLYFPEREVAAKTGTTNDYRDAWVIGYTPNFALGLWVGNNDNSPMEKKVAGFIAAPLWNAFFKKVFEKLPKEDFKKTQEQPAQLETKLKPILRGYWQGGEIYHIDKVTKKLATKFTPPELIEEKILTQIHSILYWVKKENPFGEKPTNPQDDPQFYLWEEPVREWLKNQNIKEETKEDMPKDYDDVHTPEYLPKITIISPLPNSVIKKNESITVKIKEESRFPLSQMDFYLGEIYLGSLTPPPYEITFNQIDTSFKRESEHLRIIVYDKVRNKKEYAVKVLFE
jgi:1A family penicillin-binding protein